MASVPAAAHDRAFKVVQLKSFHFLCSKLLPSRAHSKMRLDILEAWEAASDDINDLGILDTLFQAGHDFDENDYERLLALDENKHERGASTHQINNLPLSTGQTDNFQDNCAICLETPGLHETIPHLPCFRKECIDQWLGRKTWCPVCKSSILQS